jgi:hypothetical protein
MTNHDHLKAKEMYRDRANCEHQEWLRTKPPTRRILRIYDEFGTIDLEMNLATPSQIQEWIQPNVKYEIIELSN